jgi:hypothetical protein
MTTICAVEGMSDDEIKLLGHWKINVNVLRWWFKNPNF